MLYLRYVFFVSIYIVSIKAQLEVKNTIDDGFECGVLCYLYVIFKDIAVEKSIFDNIISLLLLLLKLSSVVKRTQGTYKYI